MVLICVAGFSVYDLLYTPVDYNSEQFRRLLSKRRGDGGLSPGHLTFAEALMEYAGKPMTDILKDLGLAREPNTQSIGGPGVVGAINAAQILGKRGVKVRFYGAGASDELSRKVLNILRRTPVDLTYFRQHARGNSPYTVALSDPSWNDGHGERSFATSIGVYGTVGVDEIIEDSFFEGDVLFYGGTALTPSIQEHLTSLLRRGSALGRINVVGTVFDHLSESKNPGRRWPMGESDESFKYMDVLAVDWEEALSISGKQDIHEAVNFFRDKGVHALIVSHGPEPLYAYSDGTLFAQVPLRTFPVSKAITDELRADASKVGDSTGAGDNFIGGVCAAIAEALDRGVARGNLDLADAVAWGCASGAFTLKIVGGTYLEKYPGEKRKLLQVYRTKYLQQLADAKL